MSEQRQAVCSVCQQPVDEHPFLRDLTPVKGREGARDAHPQVRVLCNGNRVLPGCAPPEQRATG